MVRLSTKKRVCLLAGALGIVLVVFIIKTWVPSVWGPIRLFLLGLPSTDEVVRELGPEVRPGLENMCRRSGMVYPPNEVTLIALKNDDLLEVWGRGAKKQWKKLTEYKIRGSSGNPGPKLQKGDMQVPEGRYSITSMNPNSNFHLSMKLNYPNRFDRKMVEKQGRKDPGDNIFIHGSSTSVGCLAMGDETIEKLFVLVNDTGISDAKVIIAPYDLGASKTITIPETAPEWTAKLYQSLQENLEAYRNP